MAILQIEKVIELLERRVKDDPTRPILKTLLDRYNKAQKILENGEDISKILIKGGFGQTEKLI